MGKYEVYRYGKKNEEYIRVIDLLQAVLVGVFLYGMTLVGNAASFYLARIFG
jgi:hypothetical protein